MIRAAFDSNILIYMAGVSRDPADDEKVWKLRSLYRPLERNADLIIPAQALGELAVGLRRFGESAAEVRAMIAQISGNAVVAPTTGQTMDSALALAAAHKLQIWDSVILTAAMEASCSILLSEDMQHGFSVHGLTVINPLVEPMHPKLAALV